MSPATVNSPTLSRVPPLAPTPPRAIPPRPALDQLRLSGLLSVGPVTRGAVAGTVGFVLRAHGLFALADAARAAGQDRPGSGQTLFGSLPHSSRLSSSSTSAVATKSSPSPPSSAMSVAGTNTPPTRGN